MCGIVGIYNKSGDVSADIYDGLIQVQHRGQDAAGIATWNSSRMFTHKELGLVGEVSVSYTHLTLPTICSV